MQDPYLMALDSILTVTTDAAYLDPVFTLGTGEVAGVERVRRPATSRAKVRGTRIRA